MDFWTANCKANITSVTRENIFSAILRAQWLTTNSWRIAISKKAWKLPLALTRFCLKQRPLDSILSTSILRAAPILKFKHPKYINKTCFGSWQNWFIRNLLIDSLELLRDKPQKCLSKQSSSSHFKLAFRHSGHLASLHVDYPSQPHLCGPCSFSHLWDYFLLDDRHLMKAGHFWSWSLSAWLHSQVFRAEYKFPQRL